MAGSQVTNSVHLPPCSVPACQPFLQQIVTTLKGHNISCVDYYEPGGLYTDRFKKAFNETTCTVMHVCPELLAKIKRVEKTLVEATEKAWFVSLRPPSDDAGLPEFLLDFHIVDLSTQGKQARFIKDLIAKVGRRDAKESPVSNKTQSMPAECPTPQPGSAAATTARVIPDQDDFQPLPKVLRDLTAPGLFVNASFFTLKKRTVDDAASLEKLILGSYTAKDEAYLSQVVLPYLYEKGDLVSLAQFSWRRHPHLRLQALHLISSFLLEKPSINRVQAVEQVLFTAIEEEYSYQEANSDASRDVSKNNLDCAELLATVYLTTIALCIIRGDSSISTNSLQLILQRPFFQIAVPAPIVNFFKMRKDQQVSIPGWYKAVKTCLNVWSKGTCEKVRDEVTKLVGRPQSTGKSVWGRVALETLFPALVSSLAKSFKDSKPAFLSFLENFKVLTLKRDTYRSLQRMIVSFLVVGLGTFLRHQSEKLSISDDFLQVCRKSADLLGKKVSSLDVASRVVCSFQMTPLLFNVNKAVRGRTVAFLRDQAFYHEQFWELLVLEATLIMWPLLEFSDIKVDKIGSTHQSWITLAATFSGLGVQTHINRPTPTDHVDYNRTDDVTIVQQDQCFRELAFLRELKHANVLRLVAFHDTCCPQFYITEDYVTTALQSVLVNKSRNSHYIPFKRLLSILLDVLKGIQYCHDNNIVHRDVTAANLFITADDTVKLAGFKHALKLSGRPEVRDFDLSFIATRWSAPESHQRCSFSMASDMWMVGHLIYEVLTHGRLPYAHLNKTDEELMPLVVSGMKTVYHEACIPQPLMQLIQQLCSVTQHQRICRADEVATKLQEIMQFPECSEDYRRYFPDLHSDEQAATKHAKGPVLSLIDDFPGVTVAGDEEYVVDHSDLGPASKGPVHFLEPCPSTFTNEEWNLLNDQTLPGITKLIGRPRANGRGERMLPFVVAAATLCSLKDAVLERWLGNDLEPYVLCLHQLASHVAYLHSRRVILCDFTADTIHVTRLSKDSKFLKVWVTSLPRIKVLPEGSPGTELDRHLDLQSPTDDEAYRRAAPEVLLHGHYSRASDVYCFGMLAWWVFNAFDLSRTVEVTDSGDLAPFATVRREEVRKIVVEGSQGNRLRQPSLCPDRIYNLITKCWTPTVHLRPRMNELKRNLTLCESDIITDDFDGYESIPPDTDTVQRRESFSSFVGRVENESEAGWSDSDFDDDTYGDLEETLYDDIVQFQSPKESIDAEKKAGEGVEIKTDSPTAPRRLPARPRIPTPPPPDNPPQLPLPSARRQKPPPPLPISRLPRRPPPLPPSPPLTPPPPPPPLPSRLYAEHDVKQPVSSTSGPRPAISQTDVADGAQGTNASCFQSEDRKKPSSDSRENSGTSDEARGHPDLSERSPPAPPGDSLSASKDGLEESDSVAKDPKGKKTGAASGVREKMKIFQNM